MVIENQKDYFKRKEVILSIVIPTLNRRELLEKTLDLLIKQLSDALITIELIVCDNASNDNTETLFNDCGKFANIVKYVRYDNRVDIDASFARSIALCSGKYINLFGDDDLPLPGFIKELTHTILTNDSVDLFYVNRVVGDENLLNTSFVPHPDTPYGIRVMSIDKFINEFTHWPGFVTCLVFSANAWKKSAVENTYFDGYNFLNRIYLGCKDKNACFIASPLVLQRRGIQSWKKFWPQYWLVSMPQLLENLEITSVTTGALATWCKKEVSTKRFLIDCFVAKAYAYPIASSFWRDSRKYQFLPARKIGSLIIQYLVPVFVAKFLYSKTNKMT